MIKMSEAKPTTITAITHSPTPLVTTRWLSPDATGCLKTADQYWNINDQHLFDLLLYLLNVVTDEVGGFGVDGEIAKFVNVALFIERHVEIVANFARVQDTGAVEVQVVVDQHATTTIKQKSSLVMQIERSLRCALMRSDSYNERFPNENMNREEEDAQSN